MFSWILYLNQNTARTKRGHHACSCQIYHLALKSNWFHLQSLQLQVKFKPLSVVNINLEQVLIIDVILLRPILPLLTTNLATIDCLNLPDLLISVYTRLLPKTNFREPARPKTEKLGSSPTCEVFGVAAKKFRCLEHFCCCHLDTIGNYRNYRMIKD